ncbi:hypothetical protein B0H19DRAFT_1384774 [Mycena capillaripes]|nr:hypothetical protein B0H19DRAFT_1384774 [Mycena capillaripes]
MAISATSIITLATPNTQRNIPGIQDQVRVRLEWSWGLGYNHLDEHLREFVDPEELLMNEVLLVFPHNDIIRDVWHHYGTAELGVRRPHIQRMYKGCKSFEYLVVPIVSASSLPVRLLTLELPPHLAICTTSGKMTKSWGALPAKDATALRVSVIERSAAIKHNDRPPLTMWQLDIMKLTHRTWSCSDYVPPNFLSETSDQPIVEVERTALK